MGKGLGMVRPNGDFHSGASGFDSGVLEAFMLLLNGTEEGSDAAFQSQQDRDCLTQIPLPILINYRERKRTWLDNHSARLSY